MVQPVLVGVGLATREEWRRCCDRDAACLASQTPEWVDALTSTPAWTDASRFYHFDDGSTFVLPLVRRSFLSTRGPHASMPDAWGFGGLVGGPANAAHIAAVISDLRRLGSVFVRIRPNPLGASTWQQAAASAGLVRLPRRAHVLDLGLPAAEVFTTRLSSSCRRGVRSAERAGITVDTDSTGRLVGEFYTLFNHSVDRWAAHQNEPLALARWRAERRDPIEKFQTWARHLGPACRISVARRDGVPIAAIIVLQGRNAHYTRGAMDRALVGNDRPNELLMWHAIRDAADAGCASFHMGESGTSETLARYKEKFGARPIDYAEYRLERIPVTRLSAGTRSAVKRLIRFRDS